MVPFFFKHFLALDLPEERVEDEEKIMTTRYTPLGVVGAICPGKHTLHIFRNTKQTLT